MKAGYEWADPLLLLLLFLSVCWRSPSLLSKKRERCLLLPLLMTREKTHPLSAASIGTKEERKEGLRGSRRRSGLASPSPCSLRRLGKGKGGEKATSSVAYTFVGKRERERRQPSAEVEMAALLQ